MSEIIWQRGNVSYTKAEIVKEQYATAKCDGYINCFGHYPVKYIPLYAAIKCYYCGQWFCESCAAEHFGESREVYNQRKESEVR